MSEVKGSCPYAVSVSDEEDNSHVEDLLEVAKTSCPAFSQSCPFSNAKNADDVRQTLLSVPSSHLEGNGHFYRALRHLHHVSQTMGHDDQFALAGGCPVQSYSPNVSFVEAMEQWSLASTMARMAQDLEKEEGGDEESSQEGEENEQEMPSKTPSVQASTAVETTSTTSRGQVSLSEALKTGTAASHQAAEDVHFVRNFIRGIIDRELYGELVLSLYHVYASLEQALDHYAPQHFEPCHFPHELSRKEALEDDVDFWHGSLPNRMSDATRDYCDRIELLSKTDPLLLLAHAYTRYLGDLSGGKILARVARRAMNLEEDGLRFYEFDHVKSAKLFKDQYRNAMNDLKLSPSQISKLVAEANVAFVLNMRLFEELDVQANIPGSSVRSLEEALNFANSSPGEDIPAECPFAKVNSGGNKSQDTVQKRCPWPFVFFHDPAAGMKDYQTWIVIGLVICWVWSALQR